VGRSGIAQLGDVVVPASGYTPRHNGTLSAVVRTFVRARIERGDDGARCWTEPVACCELRTDDDRRVDTIPDLGVFVVDPLSRRGLIARMRRDGQKNRAARPGGAARRGDVCGGTPTNHLERDP
jgi:hypothetical protein